MNNSKQKQVSDKVFLQLINSRILNDRMHHFQKYLLSHIYKQTRPSLTIYREDISLQVPDHCFNHMHRISTHWWGKDVPLSSLVLCAWYPEPELKKYIKIKILALYVSQEMLVVYISHILNKHFYNSYHITFRFHLYDTYVRDHLNLPTNRVTLTTIGTFCIRLCGTKICYFVPTWNWNIEKTFNTSLVCRNRQF